MREIKFRVWDNENYMSNTFTLADLQLKKIQFTNDCPVMQYTGLKDKNGKEIYEGDVVKAASEAIDEDFKGTGEFYDEDIQKVFWDEEFAGWCLSANRYNQVQPLVHKDTFEVIGNIYEHPHLLNSSTTDERSVANEDAQ